MKKGFKPGSLTPGCLLFITQGVFPPVVSDPHQVRLERLLILTGQCDLAEEEEFKNQKLWNSSGTEIPYKSVSFTTFLLLCVRSGDGVIRVFVKPFGL